MCRWLYKHVEVLTSWVMANRYMMEHLKQYCEAYLAAPGIIDVYNALDLLTHADAVHADQLKRVCIFQIQRRLQPKWFIPSM
jgi:hypothetical protein